MDRKCEYCKSQATFACDCKASTTFICLDHVKDHVKLQCGNPQKRIESGWIKSLRDHCSEAQKTVKKNQEEKIEELEKKTKAATKSIDDVLKEAEKMEEDAILNEEKITKLRENVDKAAQVHETNTTAFCIKLYLFYSELLYFGLFKLSSCLQIRHVLRLK
jgi:flagellar hook-basal body complex protein FliE